MPHLSSLTSVQPALLVRDLGVVDYEEAFEAMRRFTNSRTADTADEIWLLQHPPVFTQGMNGKPEHLLAPGEIPVVKVDRGGQVTYHGPGQLVVYLLLDVRRHGLGVRQVVTAMEQAVIGLLREYGLSSIAREDAPGVYINGDKVASLGLRVRRNGSYHGLSLNVDMDLSPFSRINPCGHAGLGVTQLRDHGIDDSLDMVGSKLLHQLCEQLGFHGYENAGGQLP